MGSSILIATKTTRFRGIHVETFTATGSTGGGTLHFKGENGTFREGRGNILAKGDFTNPFITGILCGGMINFRAKGFGFTTPRTTIKTSTTTEFISSISTAATRGIGLLFRFKAYLPFHFHL